MRVEPGRVPNDRGEASPEKPVEAFAAYLKAEQSAGRLRQDADPAAAAALLVGACFQEAFLRYYANGPTAAPRTRAASLAKAALNPLR